MTGIPRNSSSNTVLQAGLKALAAIACARSGLRRLDCIAGASRLTNRYRLASSNSPARLSCETTDIDPTDILGPAPAPKTP
jgi:hypothetical protein